MDMYRRDRILGVERGKWVRIIQEWKGLWDGKNTCRIADGLLAGGPHMGYFDIILADGVKLC